MSLPTARPSSVTIEVVSPIVDGGQFPSKATVGEPVCVTADVFVSSHEVVDAALRWRFVASPRARPQWNELAMITTVNDRFTASFVPDRLGRWQFDVLGWIDHAETWRRRLVKKVEAGVDVRLDLISGGQLVGALIERATAAAAADDVERLGQLADELDRGVVTSID